MKIHTRVTIVLSIVLVLTLTYSLNSFAQCVVTGSTPEGGEVVVCSGTDTDGVQTTDNPDDVTIEEGSDISDGDNRVVETLAGNDKVLMKGGTVRGTDPSTDCIELGTGDSEFHMTGGKLMCEHAVRCDEPCNAKITIDDGMMLDCEECINTRDGNDEITINGGMFTADDAIIQSFLGEDTIIITGGTLIQMGPNDETVDAGDGDDFVSVSHTTIDGSTANLGQAVNGNDGDDTIKLGSGAVILGLTSGGPDFDTLVFEMGVRPEFIDSTCANILSKNPQQDRIRINGLLYEWEDFEVILCELVPLEPKPIPTLSEWGLIGMAGLVGIAGLLAIRRRRVVA